MHVLLADDQEEIRSALRLLLEQESGLSVVGEATEVVSLVAQVQATQPDLVLLDWELPGLRQIASSTDPKQCLLSVLHAHCCHVKVIALSGRPETRREALKAGVDAFVSKGDSPEHLLGILRDISKRG